MALLVAGCDLPGKPDPADRPELPSTVTGFEPLYATHCAGCHGASGAYGPAPPLNDPLFVAIIPDDDLRHVIRNGRPGTPMPAFLEGHGGSLTSRQIDLIAEGIKQKWKATDSGSVTPPAYRLPQPVAERPTSGDTQHGRQVFAQACAGCHGANGRGGDGHPAKAGPINEPAFLALISDQAIRRIIITGRSDLGMPNFAQMFGRPVDFQPLTSAEIDDLTALLAGWRKSSTLAKTEVHSQRSLPSP